MSDVAVLHEKIMRANDRFFREFVGAMHRDVLAKNIIVPNPQSRGLAIVLQVLRRFANDGPGKKMVSRADAGVAGNIDMRTNDTAGPNFHPLVDDGVGPNTDGAVQFGL